MSATVTTEEHRAQAERPFRSGPVLLATDGEDQTDASLIAARLLAGKLHEPIEVVTVLEPLPIYTGGEGDVALPMLMETERRVAREEKVAQYMATLGGRREDWALHVSYGSIARSIAATARERTASAVVLAASPHRRVWQTVAGERAVHVLRTADCPVLSVGPAWTGTVRRAVAAVDFGSASVRAAEAALTLVEPGGTLTLLHVLPTVDLGTIDVVHAAFDRLRAMLGPLTPAGVTVETSVERGGAVSCALAYAGKIGADLITVGSRGPTIIERLFVGSTAAGVLHGAACSVLACPPLPATDAFGLHLRAWGSAATHDRATWGALLHGLTTTNAGRRAMIEVDDPAFGAQVQGVGLEFVGATYDARDGRVDIMLTDGERRTHHLTRSIAGVEQLALAGDPTGRVHALEIRQASAATLVVFTPP